MNNITIIILENRKNLTFKVKSVIDFIPFDWDEVSAGEGGVLPPSNAIEQYDKYIIELFKDENSFNEFEEAVNYAEYLCLEHASEYGDYPPTEIFVLDRDISNSKFIQNDKFTIKNLLDEI